MGLLNKVWSGLGFWDKKENAQQRQNFKAQDDEEKRRKAAEAQARAQAQAQAQQSRQQSQTNVSVSDVPRKPTTVSVSAPKPTQNVQVYKSATTPTVSVERPTAEQVVHNNKIKELDALRDQNMARAMEETKKRTSWFDRQFMNRNWTKEAEATAISRATRDYQDKYGWNNDADVINYQRGASRKLDEGAKASTSQWIAPVISTARVGTGMAEGVGGLYDLATPGKGTNRFTQAANKKAVEQDTLAKDLGVDKAYKVGNVAGEILSYAVPGMIATKGAKALNTTGKVGKIAGKYGKYVDDIGKMLDKGGDAGKIRTFLANRVRQNFTIEEAIQELMITGRYMGQNTARGGDTSWQSIATDAAMGFAGGLLVPANAANRLLRRGDGVASAQAADDVAGTTIAGATEYLDNAILGADAPPVKPGIDVPTAGADAPVVPKPSGTEVSPGVISVNTTPETPPVTPNPSVVPTNPNVAPPVQQPTNVTPPVQQQLDLPEAPRVNEVPQYQQIEAPQKPVPLEQAPAPVQVVPETAPVTTPIKEASQEVIQTSAPAVAPQRAPAPAPNPANTSDEALNSIRNQRESLLAERDALAAEGLPTTDLDRRIAQLDKAIAAKVAKPTVESRALDEGDKQLEEAVAPAKQNKKPEISKQEAPKKPKKEENVTTRQMDPEEMRAKGMSEEAIANVMAKRAETTPAETPKVVEPEKTNVAQSEPTPVTPETKAPKNVGKAKDEGAKVLDEAQASTAWTDEGVAEIKAEGEAMGATQRQIARQVNLYKQENPRPKTVAEPVATPIAKAEPEVPKAPTQRQLNKAVTDAPTTKAGKVTAAWKNQQKKAGATDAQIAKAVEKIEGKKVEPTAEEQLTQQRRDALNKAAAEKKKADEAAGLTDKAAPKVTKNAAKEFSAESENEEIKSSLGRLFTARFEKINLNTELKAASEQVDKVKDTEILKYAEDFLSNPENLSDSRYMILGAKINRRLGRMFREGKLSDEAILDVASKIEQSKAFAAANSGQVQRVVRDLYNSVPSNVRVDRELKRLDDQLSAAGIDKKLNFTAEDRNELISHTNDFDSAVTDINGLEVEMAGAMTDLSDVTKNLTDDQVDELWTKFDEAEKAYTAAQKKGLEASQAYAAKVNAIKPPLTKMEKVKKWTLASPDVGGNYLRMAMLSAPSGRIRDVISTSLNVADQLGWRMIEAGTGKAVNKVAGKTVLMDTLGSSASRKKGFFGGFKKVKSSYTGEPTLEEALGRTPNVDRSELASKDSISAFGNHPPKKPSTLLRKITGAPKGIIRASVQASTDLSYGVYTDRLYGMGMKKAEQAGLSGKRAEKYAEMFMHQPDEASIKKAASTWLENSGMHENFVTTGLKKITDGLDEVGTKSKYGPKHPLAGKKIPTANRFAAKATATAIRTTTIPFVQYMGGAMHAMAVKQNPVANVSKAVMAGFRKDPQTAVENLARAGWNTAKIGTLMAVIEGGGLEISDTDADGKSTYNAPYVVKDGKYIPASTFGIAAGGAIIAAHYTKKALSDLADGDIVGAAANSTIGPLWAITKASGLDNTISGENVFGGVPARISRTYSDAKNGAEDLGATLLGGVIGDLGTQATPAVLRDINTWFDANDSLNPTHEKPDTSGIDPTTGKVDPIRKGIAQVQSGIPGLSQQLPRKSGEQARDFPGRVLNANTQTNQQKAAISAGKTEETTTVNRTADVVKDDKVAGLLSEETRAIYDKYKGDMSKASQEDSKKMWTEITEAKDRLLDDGSYESYSKILSYERDEAKAKGSSTSVEIAEMDRKIARSNVAKEKKTNPQIFRLYTGTDTPEGGGLSQSEFKKMLQLDDDGNPEYPDLYDPETATLLWELDEAMTKAGASGNTNGIDPWTRNKYNLDEALGKGKYAKKGSGSKDKGVGTDFGTLGAYAKPSSGSQAQKYQDIDARSPLANLTKQSSKTNLKKNISVVKGVRL